MISTVFLVLGLILLFAGSKVPAGLAPVFWGLFLFTATVGVYLLKQRPELDPAAREPSLGVRLHVARAVARRRGVRRRVARNVRFARH